MPNIYYDITKNWDEYFNYLLILGGKGIGKSYSAKHKVAKLAFNDINEKFIYLRRSAEEIKPSVANGYFKDLNIREITNGKANLIEVRQKEISAYNYNTVNGTKTKVCTLGYTAALSTEANLSSGVYLDVTTIIFEEFSSRTGYLPEEVRKLCYFCSTVARNRKIRVILIGNTISRVSPYFTKWKLDRVPKQKQGTTDTYWRKDPFGHDIKIGVEYCESRVQSQMFFGDDTGVITTGAWETKKIPYIDFSKLPTKPLFLLVIKAMGFMFLARYYFSPLLGVPIWYITPKTTKIKKGTRIISVEIDSANLMQTKGFYPLSEQERIMFNDFCENRVYFCDPLCAADFRNIYRELRQHNYL